MIIYGIDVGVRNLAVVTLEIVENKELKIRNTNLIDLGQGKLVFDPFIKFHSQYMLEMGTVRIEFQHRHGKSQNTSYFLLGYLTGMGHSVDFCQPKGKFSLPHRLKMVPRLPNKSTYSARKAHAVKIMQYVCRNLNHPLPKHDKLDDIADALCYGLWATNDICPVALAPLDARKGVAHIDLEAPPQTVKRAGEDDMDNSLNSLLSNVTLLETEPVGSQQVLAAPASAAPSSAPSSAP